MTPALRREELCLLESEDLDPAYRTITVRAETTKSRRGRVVPYSAVAGSCWLATCASPADHDGARARCLCRSRRAIAA